MLRFVRWLLQQTGPRAPWVVIGVAMVLCVSSLWAPMIVDDYTQARKLNPDFWGPTLPFGRGGVMGLFDFVSPAGGGADALVAEGFLGWWASPDLKLAFWRPVSSLTHLLDHTLWPEHLWAIRLHGLVWQLGLVALAAVLLRRHLSPAEALLALVLYSWDDARGLTLGFLANRNALIAGTFGILSIVCHDRWRRGAGPRYAVLSSLCLGVGLLSGEIALSATAWLFAHAVFLDRGRWSARLSSLVPAATVAMVWLVVHQALEFGTAGSGVYVHPFHAPALFAERLVPRMAWYALGQLTIIPSDLATFAPPSLHQAGVLLGLGVTAGFVALIWPLLQRRPEARFFALGSVLSVLPVCSTFTSDRNLTFVSLGASALLAMWVVAAVERPVVGLRPWLVRGVCLVHIVWAALLLPLRCLTPLGLDHVLPAVYAEVVDEPKLAEKTVVYVWASSDFWAGFGRLQAVGKHQVVPRRGLQLVISEGPAVITRLDDRTLRIAVSGFQARESMQMVRGADEPFEVGFAYDLPDARVTVEAVDVIGHPTELLVQFHASVDDPRFVWQYERHTTFPRWTPPAVGETVRVGGMFAAE